MKNNESRHDRFRFKAEFNISIQKFVTCSFSRCKERKYYKGEKILEIRNPAFRSSGDFHEAQEQNGYYC